MPNSTIVSQALCLFSVLVFLLTSSCDSPAKSLSVADPLKMQIDSLFQEGRSAYDLPGAVVIVFKKGEINASYAFGRRNDTDSMTTETIFEAASLSKTMLTFLAHQMVKKGALALDAPLQDIIDLTSIQADSLPYNLHWLLGTDELAQTHIANVTPRMLLNHTAGFAGKDENGNPRIVTDKNFRYAENGVLLLQRVIEILSNEDLQNLAEKEIFSPMDLKKSSFTWRPDFSIVQAAGYGNEGKIDRLLKHPQYPLANGTLLTTPMDYGAFLERLFADRQLQDSLLVKAVNVSPDFPGLKWGNGIGIEESEKNTYMWQWGSNWVYRSFFAFNINSGDGFLVFANNIRSYRFFAPLSELILGEKLKGIHWARWNG